MKLNIKVYSALCALEEFKINGKSADSDDFGEHYDKCPGDAEPYGCGNMTFVPKPYTQEVLDKYGITEAEYDEICDQLDCLSFGHCGWCI